MLSNLSCFAHKKLRRGRLKGSKDLPEGLEGGRDAFHQPAGDDTPRGGGPSSVGLGRSERSEALEHSSGGTLLFVMSKSVLRWS